MSVGYVRLNSAQIDVRIELVVVQNGVVHVSGDVQDDALRCSGAVLTMFALVRYAKLIHFTATEVCMLLAGAVKGGG